MKRNCLIPILIVVAAAIILAVFLPQDPFSQGEVIFNIEKGEGSREIAIALEKEGLIAWGPIFRIYVLTAGVAESLQAGQYSLSSSMNIPQIVQKLVKGEVIEEKITIIEGWDLKDIGFYLEGKGMFRAEELYDEMPELEGYLFPDTYWVKRGEGLKDVVARMQDNFKEKTKGIEITPDIVIMASLLERELKNREDKEIASGVLWKRLKVGMPLQVDAEMWTYDNLGLPPGPICSPGLGSLQAAANPTDSPYWYYISTPDGKTIFSKTLDEHNRAIYQYLK